MATAPVVKSLSDITPHYIGENRTVRLAVLSGPADGSSTTVVLEIWEPGGAQPDNSHEASTETFVVLRGTARAHSDQHVADLGPGDVVVLPATSVHHIVNTSATERLYTITVMENDGGFADLIRSGPEAFLDADDAAVLGAALTAA
ncbi:cupin domain-containing protein [Klenkia sp. PcliD-1-E]|uniref:cupin domain-containing protein n=1 Tax=Klenkia sp. PcliD-1-E TaxID=2954492 RepID=UPI002096B291|nr:cupin domain-containing protein [Klenkia sp. PcliD-1-E]MCO7220306.1 cupin domain-containing protein [Klenkia sp. PcliD-1-E]